MGSGASDRSSGDGPKRKIEKEFGIAIPGEILEAARWSKTALKELPAAGPLDPFTIFGRSAPLVIDIGCGNGRFLLGSAYTRAGTDHIGFDVLPVVIRYATRRGNQRGFTNLRFGVADGLKVVSQTGRPALLADRSSRLLAGDAGDRLTLLSLSRAYWPLGRLPARPNAAGNLVDQARVEHLSRFRRTARRPR
jgi:SAM-dependent methyltransferase